MAEPVIGKVLWKAARETEFRTRALRNLGSALAEEGFILSDAEMAKLRDFWESLTDLSERAAYERIMATARMWGR